MYKILMNLKNSDSTISGVWIMFAKQTIFLSLLEKGNSIHLKATQELCVDWLLLIKVIYLCIIKTPILPYKELNESLKSSSIFNISGCGSIKFKWFIFTMNNHLFVQQKHLKNAIHSRFNISEKFKLFTYLNKPIQLEPRFCLLKFKQGAIH